MVDFALWVRFQAERFLVSGLPGVFRRSSAVLQRFLVLSQCVTTSRIYTSSFMTRITSRSWNTGSSPMCLNRWDWGGFYGCEKIRCDLPFLVSGDRIWG